MIVKRDRSRLSVVKILIISGIIVGLGLGTSLAYFGLRFIQERALTAQLNGRLGQASQERDQLKDENSRVSLQIKKLNESLAQKENELRQLADSQALRQSFIAAQSAIAKLHNELDILHNEKIALQNTSFSLNNRLENTTRELLKVTQEVQQLRAGAQRVAPSAAVAVMPAVEAAAAKGTLNDVSAALSRKEIQIKLLEAELSKIKALKVQQEAKLTQQEAAIIQLNGLNSGLQSRINDVASQLAKRSLELDEKKEEARLLKESSQALQRRISGLEKTVQDSGSGYEGDGALSRQRAALEEQLKEARRDLAQQAELVKQLGAERDNYAAQIARLKSVSDSSLDSSALYDGAKEQIKRLSEVMIGKDIELDKLKKEAALAQEKISALQARVADLEKNEQQVKVSQERLKAVEAQLSELKSRARSAEESLEKKTDLIATLEENLQLAMQQLAAKETERRDIEVKLTQAQLARSSAQEDLNKQQTHYEKADLLYNSLKSQIAQFSEMLSKKEVEVAQRQQEAAQLKEEIANLKSRTVSLEGELGLAKDRQKRMLDDLGQAVGLNAQLQQSIIGASQSLESDQVSTVEKQKAEELKRKIEVYLEPQK